MSPNINSRFAWGFCALVAGAMLARPLAADEAGEKKAESGLPLTKVVMFNSGVGYFEHRGDVEGDAKIDFRFRVEDINDLLKSMILEDRGGGTISTVTYGSRDPITKTLQTFPIDLTNNPTLGQLLDQVRGERVQLDGPALTGVLLGVEKRKKEIGKDHETIEVELLNLLTDSGLRSIPLDSISGIKFVNEKLDAELRQALAVLATGHNTDKKTVSLNLLGKGKRPVRVAYIEGTPVWKTSYRLVLSDKEAPFLQGWAIVENTTEADWNNVALTLVSGRPISFKMDLYEPLYVQRPLEALNLYASLRPQTYGQDLDEAARRFAGLGGNAPAGRAGRVAGEQELERHEQLRSDAKSSLAEKSAFGAAAPKQEVDFFATPESRGAVPSAQAGEVGELFQYVIGTPVTLARQKSAMLPIVNESVKGNKVSIYNEAVQAKHPLNGLRLVNSTDLHLMQGPVTVFDGGAYAGDAKIEDLSPGAERLVSYALDLNTEVAPETKSHPEQLVSVKLIKGVMQTSRKYGRTHKYTIKNSDSKPKTVLLEYPVDANWKLVSPEKPTEKTRDKYRFAVTAEPGKPAALSVEEELVVSQQLAITNLDSNAIAFYLSQKTVSPSVKTALQDIVKRKQALQNVAQDRGRLEQQISTITQEQDRIRQNMIQLEHNSDLYKRYVQKFGAQEDAVEKMREQIQKLIADEARLRQSLDDFLISLDITG
ncbi:MAG: hypothetical protein HY288_02190 [Planctomycetia bacterium]|nr:hypothetical protein [Planctomycetia bacterium]